MEKIFIQNDGMSLDYKNETAWLVDRNTNVLNKLDLKSAKFQQEYNLSTDKDNLYRKTPLCYKKEHTIVMFPDKGKDIIFFDEEKETVNKCRIAAESSVRIGIYCFGEFNDLLWAVSYGMRQLFIIDVELKKIVKCYKLFEIDKDIEMGYESILYNESVFCVSRNSNYISKTNIVSGEGEIYELSVKDKGFNTIYYDGELFWMSSMKGNIYIWDVARDKVEQIANGTGTRYRSIRVGDSICFLPFNLDGDLCDELLCCDIKTKTIFSFPINGKPIKGIYAFEYVRDDRVIGLNHSRNNYITEINIDSGEKREIYLDASDVFLLERGIREGNILYENNKCNVNAFLESI